MDVATRLKNLAVSDSGFLFDPYTGSTFSMNATGRAILDLLKQGLDAEGVRKELAKRFEVGPSDDLDRDVREFLLLLKDQGILPKTASE
jgi:hypothetical protein